MYIFGATYLAAPLLGWHLESASIAAAMGALPLAVKGGIKFFLAWPFVFHATNGVRHLIFDTAAASFFKRRTIVQSGWFLWGTSVVGGLYLAFFL